MNVRLRALAQPFALKSDRTRRPFRPLLEILEDRTTPTSLLSIAALPNPITDNNAPGTFSLRLIFDASMNPNIAPLITFPTAGENPGSSLSFTNGFFTSTNFVNDTFIANYAASDQNALIPSIDVNVANARDFANNLVNPQLVPDVFSINTQNPIVQSFGVNKPSIVAADKGTTFVITITYREPMQTTTAPAIAFSQNVSGILTFSSGTWSPNGRVYTAVYNIGTANVIIAAININVTGALNVPGFTQLPFTAPNAFSINTTSNANSVFPVGSIVRVAGDFNGDGNSDVAAMYSSGRWLVALSTGTGFLAPQTWFKFTTGAGFRSFIVGDYNDDGKDDIAYFYNPSSKALWGVLESNGGAFVARVWANLAGFGVGGWTRHLIGDFNGDGVDDVASFQNTSSIARWFVGTSTGTAFTARLWANLKPLAVTGWTRAVAGDFNGDGKTDIANFFNRNGAANWWVSTSSGVAFTTTLFGGMPSFTTWAFQMSGDFNNDNRDDLVSFNTATNRWWVSLSNGTAFSTTQWLALTPFSTTLQEVADFNNDGKSDLSILDRGSGQIVVGLANTSGNAFASSIWQTLASTSGLLTELVGDFNGDGKPDLAHFFTSNTATQWLVSINNVGSFTTTQWR